MKKEKRMIICRHCGTAVDAAAAACPGCGYENASDWSEDGSGHTPPALRPWFRYVLAGIAAFLVSALLIVGLPWGSFLVPVWLAIVALVLWKTRPHAEKVQSMERRLEKELVRMLGGDREKAARLIEYEHRRKTDSNRLQCIDNAIYHLKRDRGNN